MDFLSLPFREVLDQTNDVVLITDANIEGPDGPKILYVNEAFVRLTGYTKEEAIGQTPRILQGQKTDKQVLSRIKQALKANLKIRVELLNYSKDGKEYWLDFCVTPISTRPDGQAEYFAAIERDMSEYNQLQDTLYNQATQDSLTNALNRRRFYELANEALVHMHRRQRSFGILLIDIDDFKKVNDSQGHLEGDNVLKEIATLCRKSIRVTDKLCRFGGDEFIILIEECANEDLESKASNLINTINDSLYLQTTISVGATLSKQEDISIDDLIARADQAVYRSKKKGKNIYSIE